MNIKNLHMAVSYESRLRELEHQHQLVASGKALAITLQSAYQDDAFVDALRPQVLLEITRRIEEVKTQLRSFGIDCP